MSNGHTVTIAPGTDHVEVWSDGTLIASSDRPTLLDETGLPRRYYLPREDVRMDLLSPSTSSTHCPFKGDASYWSLAGHADVAWTYEHPIPSAEAITGLLCFYPDRVHVNVG